jgi:homoserine kinase
MNVSVKVPASTSNLGPGFDALGLALSLYNEFSVELLSESGPPTIEISGEGEKTLDRGAGNLIVKAIKTIAAGRPGRLKIKAVNRIPLARGLGSSAAAAIAGLLAARKLYPEPPLSDRQIFEYALAIEGHPDNAAAVLSGGLVCCVGHQKTVELYPLKIDAAVRVVVAIPDFELETKKSRAVVPPTVLLADAVSNIARTSLLTDALAGGDFSRLGRATEDLIHQPARSRLVPGFQDVLGAALQTAPCGVFLSGSGPTIAAFSSQESAQKIGPAMVEAWAKAGVKSRFLILEVDRAGAQVS